jgi:hypothetical protein
VVELSAAVVGVTDDVIERVVVDGATAVAVEAIVDEPVVDAGSADESSTSVFVVAVVEATLVVDGLRVVATAALAVRARSAVDCPSSKLATSDDPATSTDTTVSESRNSQAAPAAKSTRTARAPTLVNRRPRRVPGRTTMAPGNPFGCHSHVSEAFSASSVGCANPMRPVRLDGRGAAISSPSACDMRPTVRSRWLPGARLIGKIPNETPDVSAAACVRSQVSHACRWRDTSERTCGVKRASHPASNMSSS